MKFYECSFVKRVVIPALFFVLPVGAYLSEAPPKDIAILVAVALVGSAILSAIFGKRIFIDTKNREISSEQSALGFGFARKTFAFNDFDYISIHRERVYSTTVPLPAHKGAVICSLVRNDFNFIIKSESTDKRINKIAAQVKDLTGLPIKHAGEVLV